MVRSLFINSLKKLLAKIFKLAQANRFGQIFAINQRKGIFKHGQLVISLVFLPFDVRGGILVSTKAAHVGSTDWNRYCPLFPDFPPGTPQSTAHPVERCYLCERTRIVGGMSRMLKLASALAALWQCQRCNCINNSAKNKRCCFSCRAWRDGIAPSSAAGIAIADAHGGWRHFLLLQQERCTSSLNLDTPMVICGPSYLTLQ